MSRATNFLRDNSLTARVLRSTSWVLVGYAGAQAIRLASNLILTRILFPEAFGVMALVTMVTVGLMMFSDVGVGPSIQRSPRGDDPAFLDTAWTLQVVRGFVLFALTLALAQPMAAYYGEPDLALYLPIAGISLILSGFLPTKVETARRHLKLGRMTQLELLSHLIGVGGMVVVGLITQSVLALVFGSVFTTGVRLILNIFFLDGPGNRFRLEKDAMREQVQFGKWVFLSTAFAFLSQQGDKAILGKLMSLNTLGIYNIGFFLASFPTALGLSISQDVLIPLYRERPPGASLENRQRIRKMLFLLTGGVFVLLAIMALAGPWIVGFLYDDRYTPAGGMLVLLACAMFAQFLGQPYTKAALAAGDSRGTFWYSGLRAVAQLGGMLIGFQLYGLIGGLAALGLSMLLIHPFLIALAMRHKAWDALHDVAFFVIGVLITGAALALHWEDIGGLVALPVGG